MIQFSDDGSPKSPDASNRLDTEDDATSRVSRCPSAHHAARARRVAFDAWRLATLAARADELRLRASHADHLFTADARRCNSPRASAERLWRSLLASDVRARRHSASPDVSVTTSRGAGVLSDLGVRVTHLAFAEARNWMRAHAFAAFAGWRFVTTRDADRRAATVRFRATRSNSITSRLFSSWRVDARRRATIRLGVSRMTFRRERRASVVAMLTWRTRVALAPAIANAVAAATRRWRRYRLRAPFRAWRDEGLADARAFERRADAFRFATCAGAGVRALASTRGPPCARSRVGRVRRSMARASRRRDDDARVVSRHGGGARRATSGEYTRRASSIFKPRPFVSRVASSRRRHRRRDGTRAFGVGEMEPRAPRDGVRRDARRGCARARRARRRRRPHEPSKARENRRRVEGTNGGRTRRDRTGGTVHGAVRGGVARAFGVARVETKRRGDARRGESRAKIRQTTRARALFATMAGVAVGTRNETPRDDSRGGAADATVHLPRVVRTVGIGRGGATRRAARRDGARRRDARRKRQTESDAKVAPRRREESLRSDAGGARVDVSRPRVDASMARFGGVEDSPPRAKRARGGASVRRRRARVATANRRDSRRARGESTTLRAMRVSKDGDGVERVERDDARDSTRASPSATVRGVHARGTLRDCLREGEHGEYGEAPRGERRREIARTIKPLGGGARRRRRRRRARDAAHRTRDEQIGIRIDGETIGGDMGRRR